jgi:hypothetical protein
LGSITPGLQGLSKNSIITAQMIVLRHLKKKPQSHASFSVEDEKNGLRAGNVRGTTLT